MSDNHPYLNFDEYIRQGEPGMKERADDRYMMINPPKEWKMHEDTPASTPTSTPISTGQPRDKFTTNNQLIIRLVKTMGAGQINHTILARNTSSQ